MIVVDASLAAKLVLRENDSEAAYRWYRSSDREVRAPDLIAIEVAQAIVRNVNMRIISAVEGLAAFHAWRALLDGNVIARISIDTTQLEMAVYLAIQLGHPVKDCVYLALAMEFDCTLLTCDAKFAGKARGLYPAIRLLADYAS